MQSHVQKYFRVYNVIQNKQFMQCHIGFVCPCISLKPPAFCDKLALCDVPGYYIYFCDTCAVFVFALYEKVYINFYFKFYWHLQSA